MKIVAGRRGVLGTFALTMATGAIGLASAAAKPAAAAVESALTPPGATHLDALTKRLAQAPRRRDFKTVPMILNNPEQWDHEALTEVLSYRAEPKQAWDGIDIGIPWLSLIRNTPNTQIWSFKHPDFLAVSVTHGTAHLALYDQVMWDKYQLTRLAGEKFKTNTLIIEQKAATADPTNPTSTRLVRSRARIIQYRRSCGAASFSCAATMRFGNRPRPSSKPTSIPTGSLIPRSPPN